MTPSLEVVHSTTNTDFEDAVHKEAEQDITETESSEADAFLQESNIVNGEDWSHITKPGNHDVLLGRGGGTNNHSGNIKFRKLVNEHKMRYLACSKVEKPKVARQVVALWRKLEPVGRFLSRKDESKRGPGSVKSTDNVWYEVGDKKAREKASQCLRERTPDVIPYIKHLREQQNAITEHGVSMVQMQMQQQEQMMNAPHHPGMIMGHPQMHQQHPHAAFNQGGYNCDPHHHQQHQFPGSPVFQRRGSNQPPYNTNHRRPSLPGAPPPAVVSNGGPYATPRRGSAGAGAPSAINVVSPDAQYSDDYNANSNDMSEMEYQQQMLMMQQNMMQQQMEMQRFQQSRMQQQRPMQSRDSNAAATPMMAPSNTNVETTPKRSRGSNDDDARPSAPDRATSLMSLTPANVNDHELSLEDYREQLERYIANSKTEDDDASDLEDDWEKERERAIQQNADSKKRGVNRNVSGMSCLSMKSSGNMSLVSGFSGFSGISREGKMNMARSVGSNLSLMSELTDLSQNIDNLSIYDD